MRDKDIILDYVNVNEALRYLGYGDNKPDDNTKKLLDICSCLLYTSDAADE